MSHGDNGKSFLLHFIEKLLIKQLDSLDVYKRQALAEALYLTSVERNADVVTMTSYAPLLAKEGHTQ